MGEILGWLIMIVIIVIIIIIIITIIICIYTIDRPDNHQECVTPAQSLLSHELHILSGNQTWLAGKSI